MNKLLVPLLGLTLVTIIGCGECDQAEQNKAAVLACLDVMNNHEYDRYGEFYTPDFKRHSQASPDAVVNSLDDMVAFVKTWDQAFPDGRLDVQKIVAEDDLVAIWVTYSGTHAGPMGDIPATGRQIDSETFGVFRMENGKIAESWVTWDNVAVLKQLGLFPPPSPDTPSDTA